jgi:hypothetical protein
LLEDFKNFKGEVGKFHFVCFPEAFVRQNMLWNQIIWKQTK